MARGSLAIGDGHASGARFAGNQLGLLNNAEASTLALSKKHRWSHRESLRLALGVPMPSVEVIVGNSQARRLAEVPLKEPTPHCGFRNAVYHQLRLADNPSSDEWRVVRSQSHEDFRQRRLGNLCGATLHRDADKPSSESADPRAIIGLYARGKVTYLEEKVSCDASAPCRVHPIGGTISFPVVISGDRHLRTWSCCPARWRCMRRRAMPFCVGSIQR